MPYNYLFDKEARTSLKIQRNNAILIFDEVHNLESFATDATSFELTGLDIAGAINEVSHGIELVSSNLAAYGDDEGVKVDNLIKLKDMLLRIEEFLDSIVPVQGGSFAGEQIFGVLRYASGTPKLDHFIACIR